MNPAPPSARTTSPNSFSSPTNYTLGKILSKVGEKHELEKLKRGFIPDFPAAQTDLLQQLLSSTAHDPHSISTDPTITPSGWGQSHG
jgi:hypothetical protein